MLGGTEDLSASTSVTSTRPALALSSSLTRKREHSRTSLASSIVLFSGTASRTVRPGGVWAAIALAGVENATRALAVELAPLRVNAVVPGAVDTPLLARVLGAGKQEAIAAMRARLPTRRIGEARDIAQAALFLMANPFITGETLLLDGGATLV